MKNYQACIELSFNESGAVIVPLGAVRSGTILYAHVFPVLAFKELRLLTDVCTKIVFHVPVPRLCKMQHNCQVYLYTFTFIIKY